jgi:hypothetical protein
MKYVFAVLLLVGYCAAQTNPTTDVTLRTTQAVQAVNDVSFEAAQLADPQWVSKLTFPLTADTTGLASGQAPDGQTSSGQSSSGQPTKTHKKTQNEPAWEWATGLAIGVAYSYTTGSPGIGGFNLGAGWRWKRQIELCTDMDFGDSTVVLQGVTSKTKRQNYLFGGRYYIGKALAGHSKFEPFGHLMYGVTHQSVKTTQGIPVTSEISTSATTWTWDFGGGVDYLLSTHWALRGRVDWLRTHFDSLDQNHFKWGIGFWYAFTPRKMPK